MASKNLLDEVMGALGEVFQGAITDVREKVVEEPWFGRSTSPHQTVSEDIVTFAQHRPISLDAMRDDMSKVMGYTKDQEVDRNEGIDR